MPIARITGQGLAAIACSVALLWASFVGERILVRRAAAERLVVLRDLQHMQRRQHRSEPVSSPIRTHRRLPVTAYC